MLNEQEAPWTPAPREPWQPDQRPIPSDPYAEDPYHPDPYAAL